MEILPAEIPRESSIHLRQVLMPFLPQIAASDWDDDFEHIQLPPEIKRAVIVYCGSLTPDYRYLADHLG